MRFAAPEWFLLLLPLAILLWRRRGVDLRRPLRLAMAALLLAALVRPEIRMRSDGLDLWVLVDRSASASQALVEHLSEWERLLERSKGPDDRVVYVDFASEPVRRSEAEGERFNGDVSLTQSGLAIRAALSAMESDRAARILLLSDGYATEPVAPLLERLQQEQIALDYRLLVSPDAVDFRVARFAPVERAQFGEPILLPIEVAGTSDGEIPFEIDRDGAIIHRGRVAVRSGRGRIRISDRVWQGGAHRYRVRLAAPDDARRGNDQVERWVEVRGGPRLLLVTSYADDPLIGVLKDQGFELDVVLDPSALNQGRLSGAEVVILNDVPAYRIPQAFLAALDFYVRGQGGGLLMAGGKFSFGSGGYFESPIDALLPVAMDLRQEHRKLSIAMAIVMDRSGSMGVTVDGPRGPITKMKLADAGAAHAIELLGAMDQVAVFAVDSSAHRIVGLSRVGEKRERLQDAVSRVESTGGGIFVYEGLAAAWDELKRSDAGQRHVILFSDAADSEEPGEYVKLLEEMTEQKATVSVIGLGSPSDVDAGLLKDIAKRGNGRVFFTNNAQELPALFAQETVAVARSAFIEEATALKATAGWLEIAGRPLQWLSAVDGYNLSYLRPEATASALTTDEYQAPLVAHWQRGLGRAAAVSFPLSGASATRARAWEQYGDFVQTMVRWLGGDEVPAGVAVKAKVVGTELAIELRYGEEWEERMSRRTPRVVIGVKDGTREIPWRRLGPGRYATSFALPLDQAVLGAVQLGDHVLPFGPLNAGSSVEWDLDPERLRELRTLAAGSGGAERINLEDVWSAARSVAFREIGGWMLIAFLVVMLAEVLRARIGFGMPVRGRDRRERQEPEEEAVEASIVMPPSVNGDALRRDRYSRAKKKR